MAHKIMFLCTLGLPSLLLAELETLRDPTQPLPTMSDSGETFYSVSRPEQNADQIPRLQAIIIHKHKRFVILDGQRYQEGDQIRQYQVNSIAQNKVTLAVGSDVISLLFYPNNVRTTKDTVE